MLNKYSNKQIVLFLILDFILGCSVLVLYIFKLIPEVVFIVGLFILLMVFSTFSSALMQRKLLKKMNNKKKGQNIKFTDKLEFKNPLKEFKLNYGKVELYLENKVLYSLIKVEDPVIFFSDEQQKSSFNIDSKKYNKAIQFYIFDTLDDNLFRKISIFNYQAKNFYVASFIVDYNEKVFYQTDNVKPNEEYKELYQNFIKLIIE